MHVPQITTRYLPVFNETSQKDKQYVKKICGMQNKWKMCQRKSRKHFEKKIERVSFFYYLKWNLPF